MEVEHPVVVDEAWDSQVGVVVGQHLEVVAAAAVGVVVQPISCQVHSGLCPFSSFSVSRQIRPNWRRFGRFLGILGSTSAFDSVCVADSQPLRILTWLRWLLSTYFSTLFPL